MSISVSSQVDGPPIKMITVANTYQGVRDHVNWFWMSHHDPMKQVVSHYEQTEAQSGEVTAGRQKNRFVHQHSATQNGLPDSGPSVLSGHKPQGRK